VSALDHQGRALDLLLSLGADIEARDSLQQTPIMSCWWSRDAPLLRMFLSRGASANIVDKDGATPLILACCSDEDGVARPCPELISILLHASSPETRRFTSHDCSALDHLIAEFTDSPEPRVCGTMRELLAGGVPVKPQYARRMLPMAARRANELEAQVAPRRSVPMTWRGHEGMVRLSFDFRGAREADERVRAAERRVEELERELEGRQGEGSEQQEENEEEETMENTSGKEEKDGEGGKGGGSGGGDDDDDDDEDDGPWW
jgi:hypothetical protein